MPDLMGMPSRLRPAQLDQVPRTYRQVGVQDYLLGDITDERRPMAAATLTSPDEIGRRPRIARSRVVLPAPFSPIRPVSDPAATENETPGGPLVPTRRRANLDIQRGISLAGRFWCPLRQTADARADIRALPSRSLVRASFSSVHLGHHPGLVVVTGRGHGLVDADYRHVAFLAAERNVAVRLSVTCWL